MYRIETLPVYSTLEYVPDDLKNDDIQRHMSTVIIRQFKEQCYDEQEFYINRGIEHRNSGYAKMQENMFKRRKQKLQIEREKKAMEKRMESQLAHFPEGPEREKMRIILWERELEKKHQVEGLNDEIMKERERYLERQSKLLAKRQGILPGSVQEKTKEFVDLKTAEEAAQLVKASALEASIADGSVENDNNAGDFFEDDDSDSDGSYTEDEYYSSDNSSGTASGSDSGTGSEGDDDDDDESVDSEVSKISKASATSKSIHEIQDNEQLAMEQRSNGSRSARSENSRRSKLSEKLQLPLQGSKLNANEDAELTDRTEYTYHEGGRSRLNSARSAYSDDYYSAQSSARSEYSDYSTDSQGSTPRSDYSSRSGRSGYSQSTRSDYTSSTMYSARSDYSYDETPRTRASSRSDSRYSSIEPSSARTIEILSDDEDDHSSFKSIRSRSATPRSTRPVTAETENSYDRPPTPYSSRPSTAESDYSKDRPYTRETDDSYDRPYTRETDYSNDRPYTRETDDSYDRPYTKETDNTFRPLTGETADSFVSPRDSARSKRSDGSKKPDTARSRIDDVMQAQETKYLQKSTKSEGSEKRSSYEDNDKDGSIVDSNSFASQGMMNRSLSSQDVMNRSINSHDMNRSLSLSLTSLGTGDTRTRAQKKRADLYGPAPDLSVEKNTKYRPDSGYSSRSDYSRSEYSRSQNSARSDYSSVSSRTRNTSDTESSYSRGGTPPSTNRSGRSANSYDSRTPRSRLPSGDDDEYERLPTDRSGFSDHSYYSRDSSRPNTGLSLSARISGMAHIDDKNNHNKHHTGGSTHSSTGGSLSTTHLDGSTSISSRISQGLDKNEFERKRKEQRMELLGSNNDDDNSNGIKFPQIKR